MASKLVYLIMGIIFLCFSVFMVFVAIMAKSSPSPLAFISFSLMVMCFCLAYLYPQFKQKDERMKLIRQKGMFFSYFALAFYYFILMTIVQFEIFALTAMQVLNILITLSISTVFLSWVILSKKL